MQNFKSGRVGWVVYRNFIILCVSGWVHELVGQIGSDQIKLTSGHLCRKLPTFINLSNVYRSSQFCYSAINIVVINVHKRFFIIFLNKKRVLNALFYFANIFNVFFKFFCYF